MIDSLEEEIKRIRQALSAESREALLSRYEQVYAEITRYRDYEWRITELDLIFTIALTAGNLASGNTVAKLAPVGRDIVKTFLLLLVTFSTIFALVRLGWIHHALARNRMQRSEIEAVLDIPDRFRHKIEGFELEDYYTRKQFNFPFRAIVIFVWIVSFVLIYSSIPW